MTCIHAGSLLRCFNADKPVQAASGHNIGHNHATGLELVRLANCPEHFPAFPQQCPNVPRLSPGGMGISPVLRHRPPNTLDTGHCLRSGADPTVEPAPPICHGWALARCSTPVLGPTAPHLRQVSWRIAVLKPPAPSFMGYCLNFLNATHRVSPHPPTLRPYPPQAHFTKRIIAINPEKTMPVSKTPRRNRAPKVPL